PRTSSRFDRGFLRFRRGERPAPDPARDGPAPAGPARPPGRFVGDWQSSARRAAGERTRSLAPRARRAKSGRAQLFGAGGLRAVPWKSVESGYLPPLDLTQQRVVGELQAQRSHRNHLLVQHRVAVAAGDVLVLILAAADPVVLAAARIDVLHHVVSIRVLSELGDGIAPGLDSAWDVYVDQKILVLRMLEHRLGKRTSEALGGTEIHGGPAHQAEGDRRDP